MSLIPWCLAAAAVVAAAGLSFVSYDRGRQLDSERHASSVAELRVGALCSATLSNVSAVRQRLQRPDSLDVAWGSATGLDLLAAQCLSPGFDVPPRPGTPELETLEAWTMRLEELLNRARESSWMTKEWQAHVKR
jgi:hypothetical protein